MGFFSMDVMVERWTGTWFDLFVCGVFGGSTWLPTAPSSSKLLHLGFDFV